MGDFGNCPLNTGCPLITRPLIIRPPAGNRRSIGLENVGLEIQCRGFDSQSEALELYFSQLVPVGSEM